MTPSKIEKPKFRIIRDTREQTPWSFRATDYCLGHTDAKVDHGDYSIEGLEHLVFLERKASAAEVAHNIIEKRFEKLLLEAENYRYRFIVCEFSLQDLLNYPHGCGLPKAVMNKIKIKPYFIMSKIHDYQIKHGIHIIFCGNKTNAQQFTLSLFKKIFSIEAPANA